MNSSSPATQLAYQPVPVMNSMAYTSSTAAWRRRSATNASRAQMIDSSVSVAIRRQRVGIDEMEAGSPKSVEVAGEGDRGGSRSRVSVFELVSLQELVELVRLRRARAWVTLPHLESRVKYSRSNFFRASSKEARPGSWFCIACSASESGTRFVVHNATDCSTTL